MANVDNVTILKQVLSFTIVSACTLQVVSNALTNPENLLFLTNQKRGDDEISKDIAHAARLSHWSSDRLVARLTLLGILKLFYVF